MSVITGKIMPIKDNVLVIDMNFDEQVTASGIVIRSDDGKTEGVKPRWSKVWAVGPMQKDVKVGEWILVEHGRWTRGHQTLDENGKIITIRRVDTAAILISADKQPSDISLGTPNASTTQDFDFSNRSFEE